MLKIKLVEPMTQLAFNANMHLLWFVQKDACPLAQ